MSYYSGMFTHKSSPNIICEQRYSPNKESVNHCIKLSDDIPDYSELMKLYVDITSKLTAAISAVNLIPVIYDELEYFEKSG